MNLILLYAVTLAYAGQAGIAWHHGKGAESVILVGYVIANAGLIWSLSR